MNKHTNLTNDEQKLLFTYARENFYPERELRYFEPGTSLGIHYDNLLISCDVDNSVLIFKPKDQAKVEPDFGSVTAISYNPYGPKQKNFKFNPDGENIHHKKPGDTSDALERKLTEDAEADDKPIFGLEPTRRNLINSVLRNDTIPSLKGKTLNRLIQCDLCVEPSYNSKDMPITNNNVSSWFTIKEAMDKSHIVVLSWGNGAYDEIGDLMKALAACDKFDLEAFYDYLKARIAKQEVYALGFTKYNQPYQPAAMVKQYVQPLTNESLDLLFNK